MSTWSNGAIVGLLRLIFAMTVIMVTSLAPWTERLQLQVMAQIVRSSTWQNGCEINVKYTAYLSNHEMMSLLLFLRKEFGGELPYPMTEEQLLTLRRLLDSLERSL